MSALAEALVAAQRRALGAMEKAYVAGKLEAEEMQEAMDGIGLTDDVDQARLLAALVIVRDLGAAVPSESSGATTTKPDEPASDAQWTLIRRLCTERIRRRRTARSRRCKHTRSSTRSRRAPMTRRSGRYRSSVRLRAWIPLPASRRHAGRSRLP